MEKGVIMINFVICEDEDILASKYINVIDKFMMRNDAEYKIHRYPIREIVKRTNGRKYYSSKS